MTVQDQNQNQRFHRHFRFEDCIPEAVLAKIKSQIEDEEEDPAKEQEYREDKNDSSGQ